MNKLSILMIEDSEADFKAVKRALLEVAVDLFRVKDGATALNHLHSVIEETAELPQLILLDLNMPGIDGREFLFEVKRNERINSIPIIVLTSSADQRDIRECYRMGVCSYIKKPVALQAFMSKIKAAIEYWGEVVLLP